MASTEDLLREFEKGIAATIARERITTTLYRLGRHPLRTAPERLPWRGLIRCVSLRGYWNIPLAHRAAIFRREYVPWGWAFAKRQDRAQMLVMPSWLLPLYLTKTWWRSWLYEPAQRIGFVWVNDGDYYWNGVWTVRFWRNIERIITLEETRSGHPIPRHTLPRYWRVCCWLSHHERRFLAYFPAYDG